jgi:ribonuclease HI
MITIYTDGSYYPDTGEAGWGAVTFVRGVATLSYGQCNVPSSEAAEVEAIIQAGKPLENCRVILYCDSLYVINFLNRKTRGSKIINKKAKKLRRILWNRRISIEYRHISKDTLDPAHYVAHCLAKSAAKNIEPHHDLRYLAQLYKSAA